MPGSKLPIVVLLRKQVTNAHDIMCTSSGNSVHSNGFSDSGSDGYV